MLLLLATAVAAASSEAVVQVVTVDPLVPAVVVEAVQVVEVTEAVLLLHLRPSAVSRDGNKAAKPWLVEEAEQRSPAFSEPVD